MTRRVVLLVAAAVLAAGAAAGAYFGVRGSGGGTLPASKRNPILEASKRAGFVEEYHPLVSGSGVYYRYVIDNRIVMWAWPGGACCGSPVYISYRQSRTADAKEAHALARLIRQRGGRFILTEQGEPAPSDFGS